MNHYCDIWFWRASDQEAVARHLRDRDRTTSVPDTPRRASLLRSALLSMLRMTGLAKQPVEARPVEQEETPVRESCECAGEEEFQDREAVLDDGEWVLRCPGAGTSTACCGCRRRAVPSWWGWRGGGGGCGLGGRNRSPRR
jgi:hypothetical protein